MVARWGFRAVSCSSGRFSRFINHRAGNLRQPERASQVLGEAEMLRFRGQDEFEVWLQRCPIDSKCLTYRVSRCGGAKATLSVECNWDVLQESKPAPDSEAQELMRRRDNLQKNMLAMASVGVGETSFRSDHAALAETLLSQRTSDPSGCTLEEVRKALRVSTAALQERVSPPESPESRRVPGATDLPSRPDGGAAGSVDETAATMNRSRGAALAAALLQQRPVDANGDCAPASADDVRKALGAYGGASFPKPPGRA